MQSSNVPFNFYDHVAVLFPGTILFGYITALLSYLFPNLIKLLTVINEFSTALLIVLFLITAFICGHISYSLSKWVFDWLNLSPKHTDVFLSLSIVKQNEIINGVGLIYGNDIKEDLLRKLPNYLANSISGKEFSIKNYCFSLVEQHKEAKHDLFVALADFLRSTSFLLLLGTVILLIISFIKGVSMVVSIKLIFVAIIPALSSWLLLNRSFRMRRAADSVIYSQFLFLVKKHQQQN